MKFLLATVLISLLSLTANAQGSIKGKVTDSISKNPLSFATVTIFRAADTVLVTYRLSTPEGDFKVSGIPLNTEHRVVISFSGYNVYRQVFTLTNDTPLDLGTISMNPSSADLEEVLLYAERPPVSVRKDTIEFNAASFKTLPTALVEDMLKKLPGVEVDAEGNITANGKKVNRILVDGKEFFGNDPKMATRNLPANVIDKIQLTEDKDEKDLNPDKPAGEIGQVINLKLKKGVKQGWFGKAYAGGGTEERYEAGTMLNLFRDTMQLSLIGFTNNLNRAGFGFNDIRSLGGFERSGINMMMINSQGGINVNGISFGGTGEGINTSTGAGFNMNHVLKNGLTLNSQYFYGQTRNDIIELNNREQHLTDTILNTLSKRNELLKTYNHRVGLGLKGKIDSLSRFEFKPSISFIDRSSGKITNYSNESNKEGMLNRSRNNQDLTGRDINYDHNLMYFKNFRKKGRSLNISNTLYYGEMQVDQINDALYQYYSNNSLIREEDLNELRERMQANLNSNFNATYIEPLTGRVSMRLAYMGTYFKNSDNITTFNHDTVSGKHDILNQNLTNGISRESWRNSLSAGLTWKYKKLTITGIAMLQMLDVWNNYQKSNSVNKHYKYLLPGLTINWKEYNFNYSSSVNPPGISDLQPTPDSTNRLFIIHGNPDLEPAESHSFNFHYFKNITAKTLFINAYMHGNIRDNAITRMRGVTNGIQWSKPVNVDGYHDFYTNGNVNKQYKFNKDFQVTIGGGYNINYNRNYLFVNGIKSYVKSFDIGPRINGGINWKDLIEWSVRYNKSWNTTTYEMESYPDLKTQRHHLNTELVIRWPKRLVWEGNLTNTMNSQTAAGVQKNIKLLNASLTFLFLKADKGQLKLSAFDILNENVYVYRNTTENLYIDRQVNMLQRYFMATFTYNIRDFKAGKVGGTQRLFIF